MRANDEIYAKEPITFLVYSYRGQIIVRRGRMSNHGTFRPEDNKSIWLSKCPLTPMKVSSRGKVWCFYDYEIPMAKEMIRKYKQERLENIESSYISAKTNAKAVIESR